MLFEETEDYKEIKDWILGLAVTIFIGAAEVLTSKSLGDSPDMTQ